MIRYTAAPTKYDTAPYGTLCSVYKNDDGSEYDIFVQTSGDEFDPVWLSAQEIISVAFKPFLKNHLFIAECLKMYTAGNAVENIPTIPMTDKKV